MGFPHLFDQIKPQGTKRLRCEDGGRHAGGSKTWHKRKTIGFNGLIFRDINGLVQGKIHRKTMENPICLMGKSMGKAVQIFPNKPIHWGNKHWDRVRGNQSWVSRSQIGHSNSGRLDVSLLVPCLRSLWTSSNLCPEDGSNAKLDVQNKARHAHQSSKSWSKLWSKFVLGSKPGTSPFTWSFPKIAVPSNH